MDTIEGTINVAIHFHFDIGNDVLYLRLASARDQATFGEEDPDGLIILRTDSGRIAGMTIVDYWKRFGQGKLQDMPLRSLQTAIALRAQSLEHQFAA